MAETRGGVGRPCVSVTQATSPEQMGAVAWRDCICDTNGKLPGSVFITEEGSPSPRKWSAQRPCLHTVEEPREEST